MTWEMEPCRYRGAQIGTAPTCHCPSQRTILPVYACELHRACADQSLKTSSGLRPRVCLVCDDWETDDYDP